MSGHIYGNDEHVEALAQRLHRVHPDGDHFGLDVMRSLAQMALISGANPMPGANGIQLVEDEQGRPYMMFGYAYWNNQIEAAGGMMWEIRPRPMTDMERMEWGVPQKKLAWICAGALYRDVKRLRDEYHAFGQNDVTLPDVRSEAAVVGIGVADESVQQVIGRTRNWVAEKRARTDLCRKLLPEVAAVEQGDAYGDVDEDRLPGWYNELVPDTSDAPQTETIADINDLLFGAAETRSKQPPASKTADSKPKGSNEPQTRSEPTTAASSPTPSPTDRSRANGRLRPPAHDPTEEVMRDFMADVADDVLSLVDHRPSDPVRKWVGHLEKLLDDHLLIERDAAGEVQIVVRLRGKKQGSYRMGSATDPDATYRKHGEQDDLGYNVSVLTDGEFVREIQADTGATPDAVPLPEMLENQREHHDLVPEKVVYDQAAGSGKTIAQVHQATDGETQLVVRLREVTANGKRFGPRDFEFDAEAQTLTCPQGKVSDTAYRSGSGDGWDFRFSAEQCADCPLRKQCRAQPEKETKRSVFISDYRTFEEEARAYTETESYRREMRSRGQVERVIACLVRYCGARRARGRGLTWADFQAKMAGAVFNAKRLAKKMELRRTQTRKTQPKLRSEGGVRPVTA